MQTAKQRSLSNKKDKIFLDWDTYINYINVLSNLIKKSKIKFDFIYGISRGGLIPATILSHKLNIELIDFSYLNTSWISHKKLLICDDLIDTGETVKRYLNFDTIQASKLVKVATIYKQSFSPVIPDYYVATTENWIVFPYEKN
jgi:hypoxanthine phosphoribosyltransferase